MCLFYTKNTIPADLFQFLLFGVYAGSGDLAALGILEDGFKSDLEVKLFKKCLLTYWKKKVFRHLFYVCH